MSQRDLSKHTRLSISLLVPMLSGVPANLCTKALGTQHPNQLGFSVAAPVHVFFPPLSSLPAFAEATAEPSWPLLPSCSNSASLEEPTGESNLHCSNLRPLLAHGWLCTENRHFLYSLPVLSSSPPYHWFSSCLSFVHGARPRSVLPFQVLALAN